MRMAEMKRETKETKIVASVDLDGGESKISTGIGFFDHMLTLFAKHSNVKIDLVCEGDLCVDCHHTVEDVGIVLGSCFKEAMGDKRGIERFADRIVPMDETVVMAAIDISGRPFLTFRAEMNGRCGTFDLELVEEFFRAFCFSAGINLYVKLLEGTNGHHKAEGIFKAVAKCLSDALKITSDSIPSTKGVL